MGQQVANEIDQYDDLLLIGGFDKENNGLLTIPVYTKPDEIEEKPDVIIDFSVPIATMNLLEYAKASKVPMVIATTGFSEEQLGLIKEASSIIPIFQSSNMSFEVSLMSHLVATLASKLKDSDIEIIETHHNRKIDSPSGTALLLADSINEALGNTMTYEMNRHDKHEKRSKNEIGISSVRGGNIVGEHSVLFFGEHETFEISHKCYSRSVFAQGSLKAAKFIVAKQFGYYNMKDLVENI